MSRSRLTVLVALMLLLFTPALAMSPSTAEFLRSAGIGPDSEAAQLADADGTLHTTCNGDPVAVSLEKLVAEGAKKNGAGYFVITRTFIRALKAGFAGTPVPPEGYDGACLTPDEKKLALRKVFGD